MPQNRRNSCSSTTAAIKIETEAPAQFRSEAAQEAEESELSELSELSEDEDEEKPQMSFNDSLSKFKLATSSVTTSKTRITRSTTALVSASTSQPATPTAPTAPTTKKRAHPLSIKTESSSSTTTKKRAKVDPGQGSRYAPPEKYAHLGGVTDAFAPNLISVFIGLNPGIATATAGHAYASPSNHFWRFLHSSGLTPDRKCPPETDTHLPRLYSLGNTNLVKRATKDQAELSTTEMDASVEVCEAKIRKWKPESVCVVGKGIWESIWRAKHGGKKIGKDEFVWGWQVEEERFGAVKEEGYKGAKVFVVPSTSGLVAGYSMEFKQNIWKELGDWVQMRRKERGETAPRTNKEPKVEVEDES